MTLLLAHDRISWPEICENGPYYEGKHVLYDYSEATMYPRSDNNGFIWDKVVKEISVILKEALSL